MQQHLARTKSRPMQTLRGVNIIFFENVDYGVVDIARVLLKLIVLLRIVCFGLICSAFRAMSSL